MKKYKEDCIPQVQGSPKFYGLPKIHKPGIPLWPIISSIGTVTSNTAKELAKILKPLVGLSTHHVHNTKDFVEQLKDVWLKQEESIISYDVTALFTSVPMQPVLKIIEQKLANDKDLQQRTIMSIKHIIRLLEFCLRSTYFVFQGQYYEQVEGAAMGSPLSPIVANIFMKNFETKALETAQHPPKSMEEICGWHFCHFGNRTQRRVFQSHQCHWREDKIHSWNHQSWWIHALSGNFSNTKSDGSLSTRVYRKPTHTNQYLQWDSHHAISNKYSVINSLLHRAKDICSNQDQLEEEQTHINKVLSACKYPAWAIKRVKLKTVLQEQPKTTTKATEPIPSTEVSLQYHTIRA